MLLKDIDNKQKLCEFLRTDVELLEILLDKGIENFCIPLYLPKRNPKLGFRKVYKIYLDELQNIHKAFHFYLNQICQFSESVHGFVAKKSIVTNASAHLAKNFILTVDIEKFFESISFVDIKKSIVNLGARDEIAELLSRLITIEGTLVQGFVTSPMISNLCVIKLDTDLESFSKINGYRYTRYADDITFSGDKEPPLEKIREIIENNGFLINKNKISLSKRGKKQYVTGLTVFDKNSPRIPKRFKKRLRLELYFLKKYGFMSFIEKSSKYAEETPKIVKNRIKGWIDYINSVEPARALELNKIYKEIEVIYYSEMKSLIDSIPKITEIKFRE